VRSTAALIAIAVSLLAPAISKGASSSGTFKNCTAMHKKYPHGVGKPGARDHTTGTPVTTFRRSATLYALNKRLDRDKDGIACEQA
jgi:hypothetical protein